MSAEKGIRELEAEIEALMSRGHEEEIQNEEIINKDDIVKNNDSLLS